MTEHRSRVEVKYTDGTNAYIQVPTSDDIAKQDAWVAEQLAALRASVGDWQLDTKD